MRPRMMAFLRLGGGPTETAAAEAAPTPLQQQVLRCPSVFTEQMSKRTQETGSAACLQSRHQNAGKRLPGLLGAPLAAQRAWPISNREAPWEESTAPQALEECACVTGGREACHNSRGTGRRQGGRRGSQWRGELRPANVHRSSCRPAGEGAKGGEGPGLVTESGEGQPAHCVTLGKGPRLPGASFTPRCTDTIRTEVPSGSEDYGCQLAPPALSSSKLGAEKPVLGTRSLHAIFLEEDAVVSVDSSTPT